MYLEEVRPARVKGGPGRKNLRKDLTACKEMANEYKRQRGLKDLIRTEGKIDPEGRGGVFLKGSGLLGKGQKVASAKGKTIN